jgi:tetratricopeptide (TPR) repeat protein
MACAAIMAAGCGQNRDAEVAALKSENQTTRAELERQQARVETLQDQLTRLDTDLRDARDEATGLRVKLAKADKPDAGPELQQLQTRITELEAEIERLKFTPVESPAIEPAQPEVKVEPESVPDPEARKKLDDLLPLVMGENDTTSLETMLGILEKSDRQTRDDYIARIRQWVKEEPQNKRARLALALTLTTRFQDLEGDMMKQAVLAQEVQDETNAALKIDPEFYEAVHFLAILKASYPSFTPEFKDAHTTLDKALELQKDMTWEDDFAEIYAAYAMWYRVQKKYDEAAAKVQAGLDHAPRNEGLLAEQQAIEDARNAGTEE